MSSNRRGLVADVIDRAAAIIPAAGGPARARAFLDDAGLDDVALAGESPAAALRAASDAVRSGPRRRNRVLTRAVRALLVLAAETGADPELDPLTAGVAAFYAAGTAPADRRAAIAGRTVQASDAEWSFGHGPVISADATAIAAFLLGVSDEPPRPPAPGITGR
ncbi:hypothetical protein ACIQLJ_09320 [Microbacterium sp. NPDC091313]